LRGRHIRLFDLEAGCAFRHKSLDGLSLGQGNANVDSSIARVLIAAPRHGCSRQSLISHVRFSQQTNKRAKVGIVKQGYIVRGNLKHDCLLLAWRNI
jgi:hypothetical protein